MKNMPSASNSYFEFDPDFIVVRRGFILDALKWEGRELARERSYPTRALHLVCLRLLWKHWRFNPVPNLRRYWRISYKLTQKWRKSCSR